MSATESVVLRLNDRLNALKRTISSAQAIIDKTERDIKSLEAVASAQHAVIERSQFLLAELEDVLGDDVAVTLPEVSDEAQGVRVTKEFLSRRPRHVGRASEMILGFLKESPTGMTGPQIADHLASVVGADSPRPRNMVFSTLYNLRNAGRVTFDAETGVYLPAG